MTAKQLERNLWVLKVSAGFRGFVATIPIWVSFFAGLLTFEQLATLYALRYVAELVLELPTGAFADLFGKKTSVGIGGIVQGVGYMLVAVAQNPVQVFVFMMIAELGITLESGAIHAWAYDSLKENGREKEYGRVMSETTLAFQISMAIAILCGGYMYAWWRGLPWVVEGLAMVVAGGIFWLIGTEPIIDTEVFTWKNYFKQTKNGFKEIWKSAYVRSLSVFYMVVGGFSWSAQKFFNQIYATQIGYSDIEKSWLFSFIRVFNVVALTQFLKSSRLFSRNKGLVLFSILFLLFFVPTPFASKLLGGLLLFGLTFASTARTVILNQFANEEFESRVRATALSSLNMLVGLMYVAITYVSGFFLEDYGAGVVLGVMGVIAVLITTPLAVRLVRRQR